LFWLRSNTVAVKGYGLKKFAFNRKDIGEYRAKIAGPFPLFLIVRLNKKSLRRRLR
jgi:hypothetical protein